VARSIKKGFYVQESLLRKVDLEGEANRNKVIKTWSRRSMILPEMVGLTIAVHNGRQHVPVLVNENMIGHTGFPDILCARNSILERICLCLNS